LLLLVVVMLSSSSSYSSYSSSSLQLLLLTPPPPIHVVGVCAQAFCSMDQVELAISEWEPRWTATAAELVRTGLWLPIEVHHGLQPKAKIDDDAFISGSFMNLDGKVFTCSHSRKASAHSSAMHSNKTGTSGLQCLGWSAPCGIPLIVRVAEIVLPVSASFANMHPRTRVRLSDYY
jgi:hypothetical protein